MNLKLKLSLVPFLLILSLFITFLSSCDLTGGGPTPENNPPNTPSSPFPEDGSSNMPIKLTLLWKCSDPDGDPLVYDLYFGTSQENLELLASNLPGESYTLTEDLEYSTTYYWKVVAKDDSGAKTEGPVWKFTTVPAPNYPPVFTNLIPSDNAQDQPLDLILQWHAEDQNDDEVTYDLYFGTTRNLVLIKSNMTDEFYQFGVGGNINLSYDTTYYWKVVAKDGRGGETDSGILSFRTRREDNVAPDLTYSWPPNGSEVSSYSVKLQWFSSDPNGDPLKFDIYFGTNPSPPLLVSNHDEMNYTVSVQPNRVYYWRIVAKDNRGGITYGDVMSFRSPTNNPPDPFTINPLGSNLPVRNVVLNWNPATDPENDPVRYYVYFGTRSLPDLYRGGLRGTNLVIRERLEYNKTYYWKVVAVDDKGNERVGHVVCTGQTVDSFTTAPNIPPVITIISPPDGSTNVKRSGLRLRWMVTDSNGDRWKIVKVELGTRSDSLSTIMGESGWFDSGRTYELQLNLLPANTVHYWRVTVMDEGGLISSTTVHSFRTSD